jgi:hypothetical protein
MEGDSKMLDFDTTIKLHIYKVIAETTHAPTSLEVAQALKTSTEEAEAAFQRLYEKRLLVLEPGDPSRIRMAPPFSGIKTSFAVTVGGKTYYANCAWDALGIPAALQSDGDVDATDGFTGEAISLQVRNQSPVAQECVIHFAVPAARWWDDIIYT